MPSADVRSHFGNLREISRGVFVNTPVLEITPPEEKTPESCYVLTADEPSLLQRTFKRSLTNARLGTKIGTKTSALYEFVFPPSYGMVRLHAKPWQTSADLPGDVLQFGKPRRAKQYRYEPFIILRKVRAAEGPVRVTRNDFAVECADSIKAQAMSIVTTMNKRVRGSNDVADYSQDDSSSFSYAGSNSEDGASLQQCSREELRLLLAQKVEKRAVEYLVAMDKCGEEQNYIGLLRKEVETLGSKVAAMSNSGQGQ